MHPRAPSCRPPDLGAPTGCRAVCRAGNGAWDGARGPSLSPALAHSFASFQREDSTGGVFCPRGRGRPHGEMRGFRGEQGTAGGSRSLARLHAGRAVEALGARCVRVQAPLCLGVCLVNRCLEKTLQVRTLRCPRLTQLLMKRIKLAVFPFSGYSSEPCRTCTDSWNHPAWLVLCKMVMCASGLCTPLVPGKMQVMRRSDGPRMLPTKKQPSDVGGGPCVPKNR